LCNIHRLDFHCAFSISNNGYFERGTEGFPGAVFVGSGLFASRTDVGSPVWLARIANVKLVSIKQAANIAVARVSKFAVPRTLTKPEPLPPPPMPNPPPSLRCRRTTTTKAMAISK
jgi:hypothetical protein